MKKSVKWMLGIVIGLLVVAVVVVAGYFVFGHLASGGFQVGSRFDRPWNDIPRNRMPMMPDWGTRSFRSGIFYPLGFLASCLLCLGVISLIVVGVIALVRNMSQPKTTVAQTVATPVAAPEVTPAPVAEPEPNPACPNCAQPVQPGWKHCPHCGAPLT